jgi:uncharacterized membrane protein
MPRGKMRKIIIVLLLISLITTSAYAVNIFDRMLYKKVMLICIHRYALVSRLNGAVTYIMRMDGTWGLVQPALQNQYQSMYKAQTAQ